MFDGVVRAIEKGIELVERRQRNDREFFHNFIQPLFNEFEQVVQLYLKLFDFDRHSCSLYELKLLRGEYIQARLKVTELADSYNQMAFVPEVKDFLDSIVRFFFDTVNIPAIESKSVGLIYILNFESGEMSGIESEEIIREVADESKNSAERKWAEVVRNYGNLRLKYDLPIGYSF